MTTFTMTSVTSFFLPTFYWPAHLLKVPLRPRMDEVARRDICFVIVI